VSWSEVQPISNMNLSSCFRRHLFRLGSLLVVLLVLPACTTVQVTENTIGEFKFRRLETVVNANFADTYNATKRAFEEHGLFVTGDDRKIIEADLSARDRSDTLVNVKLKEVAVGQTSVRIRYGITGDAARSQQLFRSIQQQL
jgi:hypothetical protein